MNYIINKDGSIFNDKFLEEKYFEFLNENDFEKDSFFPFELGNYTYIVISKEKWKNLDSDFKTYIFDLLKNY